MNNKSRYTFFIAISVLCIYVIYITFYYFSGPTEHASYNVRKTDGDSIRIAFIGDSWALMHKFHQCVIANRVERFTNCPTKVTSFGYGGLTSKNIYEQFFDEEGMKPVLLAGADYCIISAGINDTYFKMKPSYFKSSMNYIIRFLLANHIHPILLEIPNYDIEKAYRNQKIHRKIQTLSSMFLTGTQMNCKQQFRETLNQLIKEEGYEDKVTVIRYKEWNGHFSEDQKRMYQTDGVHLNEKGYEILDSCIARHIVELESRK